MAKLFELTAETSFGNDYRLALGKVGVPSKNITVANFIVWLKTLLGWTDYIPAYKTAIIAIGTLDMTGTFWKHITSWTLPAGHAILAINATIIDDNGNIYPLVNGVFTEDNTVYTPDGAIEYLPGTNDLGLGWKDGGMFDNANFNGTGNRGWVKIDYYEIPV